MLTTLPIVLIAFPLFFFLPGYFAARALFRDPTTLSPGEKVFIPIAASILISTWFGFVLAEFGLFSLGALLAPVLIFFAAVWFLGRRRRCSLAPRARLEQRPHRTRLPRVDWVFLAILALGIALAARPAEYILGGSDAGVYVNLGINIARTGALAIHDPLVQALPYDPSRQFFWDLVNPFMLYKQVRLPGFFVADAARGLVLPQFLHLYPVWLAIFDSILGLRWGLYATPVIGVLGSVAAYFVARTLFGRSLARLAFFLLVISVPQFWFARYPVAEALTQFLLLTGMYAFLRSGELTLTRAKSPTLGTTAMGGSGVGFPLLAGVAFALIFFTRADAILLLAPLGIYALVIVLTRRWGRAQWAFFGAFGVLFAHALAHVYAYAPMYIYFQYSHFLRMKNIDKLLPGGGGLPTANDLLRQPQYLALFAIVTLVGAGALFVLDRAAQAARTRWGDVGSAALTKHEKTLRGLGVGLVVVLFVLAYFILPRPTTLYAYVGGETPLDRSANLIKLGWYLSPFGLALALLGAVVTLARDLDRRNAFFFGTGALFSFFYLEELYSNPHYIYTLRHYIPLVIPLFVLLAARALVFLWRELPRAQPQRAAPARAGAGGLFALWMLYNLYAMGVLDASRASGVAVRVPFVAQTMQIGPVRVEPFSNAIVGVAELGGAFEQTEELAEQVPTNAVIIFSNNRDEPALLATPLRYLYDRDALVARFNQPNGDKVAALIDAWRAQGRPVLLAYGTNGGKLAVPRYRLDLVGHFAVDVPQWAFAYRYMPRAAWRVNLNYALYRAEPQIIAPTYPYAIDFGGDDFPALVGGFLERPTEGKTRWIGALPDTANPRAVKALTATLRVPAAGTQATLEFTLRARAAQAGMALAVGSGNNKLGEATLTRTFADYHFTLPRANLKRDGDTFLIALTTPTFVDAEGRILGAELESAVVK